MVDLHRGRIIRHHFSKPPTPCATDARSRTLHRMTESSYRMRLLSVHPLDAPVVALAASARPGRRGGLTAVGAVKCHGSREFDAFHAADASAMTALARFADGLPHRRARAGGRPRRRRGRSGGRGRVGRARSRRTAHARERRRLPRAARGAAGRGRACERRPAHGRGRPPHVRRLPRTHRAGAGARGGAAAAPRRPADAGAQPARRPRLRTRRVACRNRRRGPSAASTRRRSRGGWSVPAASACRSPRNR